MDDLLSEFLTETNENLAVLDVELVKLEQNPNDIDLLSNIFRLVHTVKGTCGFLGLPRLESVAHAGENVLGKVRDGDVVRVDGVSGRLDVLVDAAELSRRETPPPSKRSDLGVGRELFSVFRRNAGPADAGASIFGNPGDGDGHASGLEGEPSE